MLLTSYTATVLLEAASSLESEPQAPNPNRDQEVKLAEDLGHCPTSSAHTAVPSGGHCRLPTWQEGTGTPGRRNRPEVSEEPSEHPPHTRLFTEARFTTLKSWQQPNVPQQGNGAPTPTTDWGVPTKSYRSHTLRWKMTIE